MPAAGGGFDQCYNAQAAVAAGSLLVVATRGPGAHTNQVEPMLEKIGALPEGLGKVDICWPTPAISARARGCVREGRRGARHRDGPPPHHPPLSERFEKRQSAEDPTPVEAMAHR